MSINPAIWRKASRLSSPRLLWRVLPRPAKAALVGPAFIVFLLAGAQIPWATAFQGFQQRRAERASLAPLFEEAERLDLTFPQVVVAHPAYVGKPVYWAVQSGSTSARIEEHPAWLVVWTNPERVNDDQVYGTTKVLARVAAVNGDAVYLDYLGRP